ncbi:MAG: hypothetical protein Ct9H300mP19_20390 [Dehalococcoidia bacterium]|nr:MAG: hypothetical protein Ct9H300mP19_20390 [Dehalococcoidia bacterium]
MGLLVGLLAITPSLVVQMMREKAAAPAADKAPAAAAKAEPPKHPDGCSA